MRNIVYCATTTINEGSVIAQSGCGIILQFHDNVQNRKWTREIGFPLGGSTAGYARIISARLSLASIRSKYRKYKTIISVDDDYVVDLMLNQLEPKPDESDQYAILKEWFGYYSDLTIKVFDDYEEEEAFQAMELSERIAARQTYFDSTK